MPPKPNLVFNNAPNGVETDHSAFNVKLSPTKPEQDLSHTTRPSAPIIEDWVSDSKDEYKTKPTQNVPSFVQPTEQVKSHRPSVQHVGTSIPAASTKPASLKPTSNVVTQSKQVPITAVRPVSTDVSKTRVTRPKHANHIVTKPNSLPKRHIHRSPSPKASNSPPRVTAVKAPMVSAAQGNMSYLSDFEELNGGYVAFGGNPKGDSLGKFNGKVDERFLVGYSVSSKAFRVLNSRTRIVQETLLVNFLENKPNVVGRGPTWEEGDQQYVLFPVWSSSSINPQNTDGDATFDGKEPEFDEKKPESEVNVSPSSRDLSAEFEDLSDNSINEVNAAGTLVHNVGQISLNSTNTFSVAGPLNAAASPTHGKSSFIDASQLPDDPEMPKLEDFNNLEISITVSPIPTTRVHKDHPVTQIIGDLSSATQTRSMTRVAKDQGGLSQMFNDDFHTCMFACFLSQEEPKRDERGIVVKNKARLVAQGHTLEEGINYEEVFAPVARIEAIRLFLAYASFTGFMVYQMDVKSAFLYETIEEEVYVCQPPGIEDPDHPDKVYKVVKALYGLHQAPRAWYETLANYLLENGFQREKIDQTLFIKRQKYTKSASTPIDIEKPLLKDPDGEDVDVRTYRSMISSLMYLTLTTPNIMFALCACARFQMIPKASHLHAVKRIFRYLKGKPHLGLWYPKDSPFDLVAYSDSDYAGASLDRKSTTGGCQFLVYRLISWQCKKQTVVATSSTEAEFVAAASCCAQVLWIQNQLLDYG
nr:putative reverse transcriptase, RNA-dependent DNA polymerase [Tanacetum cinerariifolium]